MLDMKTGSGCRLTSIVAAVAVLPVDNLGRVVTTANPWIFRAAILTHVLLHGFATLIGAQDRKGARLAVDRAERLHHLTTHRHPHRKITRCEHDLVPVVLSV